MSDIDQSNRPPAKDIEQVIRQIIDDIGRHPAEINSGQCVEVSQRVVSEIEEAQEPCYAALTDEMPPYTSNEYRKYGGHSWVQFDGRHYDAEDPQGVDCWRDLTHFERQ